MRKFLTLLAIIAISASVFAQKEVTKFMGIPVDGSPTEMIKKLKAKGFTTDKDFMQLVKLGLDWDGPEVLIGRFNGEKVRVTLRVEQNKVWRIYLSDKATRDETQIRIRFNTLVRQFEDNGKYVPYYEEQIIADDEDISYEMTVKNKQYEAIFVQKGEDGTVDGKRMVWFKISQRSEGYYIAMFYDNEYNQADGSDL